MLLIIDDLIANVTQALLKGNLLAPPGLTPTESGTTVYEVLKACDTALLNSGSEAWRVAFVAVC